MNEDYGTYYHWNRSNDKTIFIDSIENPVDSLETGLFFLENRKDNLKWKWIVLSLHHALYLFCVANLESGNFLRVLSNSKEDNNTYISIGNDVWKKSKKNPRGKHGGYMIEWSELDKEEVPKIKSRLEFPSEKKQKLMGFWTAIARVLDKEYYMARLTISKPLQISDQEWESIEKLNYYRNEFTHFIPSGLAIYIVELKGICKDIIRLINCLALETNQVVYVDENARDRVKKSIRKYQELLN